MEKKSGGGAQFYVGQGGLWAGPLSRDEVVRKLEERSISWADFLWSPSTGMKWTRICEMALFRANMPNPPGPELIREIQTVIGAKVPKTLPTSSTASRTMTVELESRSGAAAAPAPPIKKQPVWYLQFEGSEFGPMTAAELNAIVKSGKLSGKLLAKSDQNPNWHSVDEIKEPVLEGEETKINEAPSPSEERGEDRRRNVRVPFVGTIHFRRVDKEGNKGSRKTGICRDLSEHGMLVFSSQAPTKVGTHLIIEVHPIDTTVLPNFSCRATVSNLLKGGAFSIKFDNLDEEMRDYLHKFLLSA